MGDHVRLRNRDSEIGDGISVIYKHEFAGRVRLSLCDDPDWFLSDRLLRGDRNLE